MSNSSYKFVEKVTEVLNRITEEQMPNIEKAAQAIAKSLMDGGVLNIFGSGHSTCSWKKLSIAQVDWFPSTP